MIVAWVHRDGLPVEREVEVGDLMEWLVEDEHRRGHGLWKKAEDDQGIEEKISLGMEQGRELQVEKVLRVPRWVVDLSSAEKC